MADASDVVVVGGGIGGASLAFALARAGVGVRVLEATTEFADRVRGESMQAWGVKEARDVGVEQVLLDAGAHITPVWKQYTEGAGDVGDIPMAMMIPDIPGSLNLRHPDACQALLDAAADAGATVVRGVRDVVLADGSSPTVTYATKAQVTELRTTLVVGADGRASTVRKQAGISLDRQEPMSYIAGLLVDGLDSVPDDHDVVAGEGDVFFLVFHQRAGRARVYLCTGSSRQHRFSGRTGTEQFLAACNLSCYPWSEQVMTATPAGPCATYAGDDTWTDAPFADGVVLIGDAAGYNDPIIGQGLSIALRDARVVRDLILDGARQGTAFAPYGEERSSRMERLRFIADVIAVAQAEDADNRSARRAMFAEKMAAMDPEIFPLLLGAFAGPETVPGELLDPGILERLRGA
jgi:2-polyprenyl-6-methoxyphenol hydroxylase-like FAD-dependent oxidoreductase